MTDITQNHIEDKLGMVTDITKEVIEDADALFYRNYPLAKSRLGSSTMDSSFYQNMRTTYRNVYAEALQRQREVSAVPEGVAKDAARYRWLRKYPTHFAIDVWGKYGAGLPLDKIYITTPEKLDKAIDAAIKEAAS